MKFRTFALAAVFAASALTALAAVATARATLAPANEYFGRLRISIVGIRNSITTLSSESADATLNSAALRARIAMIEDALTDWQRKYPHDPGIARFRSDLASLATRVTLMP